MHSHRIVQGSLNVPQKLEAKRIVCPSRTAAGHKLQGLDQRIVSSRIQRRHRVLRLVLQASTSSFEQRIEDVKEEADNKIEDVPKVGKDIKPPALGRNKPKGVWGFYHNIGCYLRHKAWVVAWGMYYLYNEAVAKLPWIKIKRFEKWFWTTSKKKWIDSSSAATVLARKYMDNVKKDLSWSKTTAELTEKKEEMEEGAQEKIEDTKEDIDEAVNNPGASMKRAFSNGRRQLRGKLPNGPSAMLDNMSTAARGFQQKVPMLQSKDQSEEEGYEQEERSSETRENALAASASMYSQDLDDDSKAKAADEERAEAGKEKKKKSDGEAMKNSTLANSFLGLFRKENEDERPSEQKAPPLSWSLPIPFWKRN